MYSYIAETSGWNVKLNKYQSKNWNKKKNQSK